MGTLDEVRISKSVRYTTEFTPPPRVEPDKDTIALYHFDEGSGDVLKDSSGNGHHGKIVGAKWVKIGGATQTPVDPERAVAEWVIGSGGEVELAPGGRVSKLADLPQGAFTISVVTLRKFPNLTVADVDRLATLRALNGLNLEQTTLSVEVARRMAETLSIETLTHVTGATTPGAFLEFVKLRTLRFIQTYVIDDEFLAQVGQLKRLHRLHCGGKMVTEEGLVRLAANPPPKLNDLSVGINAITVKGTRAIAQLPHLGTLNLGKLSIREGALAELQRCRALGQLNLMDSNVTQAEVTALQNALKGCRIIVSKVEQATAHDDQAYRDTVRQLMARGYSVLVTTNTSKGETWVRDQQAFPPGDVLFVGAITSDNGKPASSSLDDLRLIAKLRDLTMVGLNRWPADGLRELAPLQNLMNFGLAQPLSDAEAAVLASFPKLNTLEVTISSDASLQSIARLPHLSSLELHLMPDAGVNSLKPLEAVAPLCELYLSSGGKHLTEADAQAFANARPDVVVTWQGKRIKSSDAIAANKKAVGSKRTFASDEWIDVLPLIDPALDKTAMGSFSGKNDWRIEQGELKYFGDTKAGKVFFPVRFLGRSLEWEIEFTRTTANAVLFTDIPIPGGFVPISVNSDKIMMRTVTLSDQFRLVNGQRVKLRFRVTQDGANDRVELFVNEAPAADWKGRLDNLRIPPSPNESRNQAEFTGVSVFGPSNYTFHAIRARMLNGGTAELLRPLARNAPNPFDILTSPDYEWSAPENLGPGVNGTSYEHSLAVSADGLILVVASRRSGGQDLFECRRQKVEDRFGAAVPIKELNTPGWEGGPFLSADGLTLLFHTQHGPNEQGSSDLYQTRRRDRNSPWENPANLGPPVNTPASEEWPCLSSDGLTLLFSSERPGGKGGFDVWRSRRKSVGEPFGTPENLGSGVNSGLSEVAAKFAADNQTILFVRSGKQVPGAPFVAISDSDGNLTSRPLNMPVTGHVNSPTLSPDARTMYFTSPDIPGGLGSYDGWQMRRVLTPAAAARAGASGKFVNNLGMEFVRVPKGKSWLGGGGGKPGTQEVEFKDDFYLGKYEVTQGDWQNVMGATLSHFSRTGGGKDLVKDFSDEQLKRFPVDNVTWTECQDFLKRLNEHARESGWTYRLPTVAEWEYACRGGPLTDPAESAFDFYLEKPMNELLPEWANAAVDHKKLLNRTSKVGDYRPNRLGLYDMHGNVYERCDDVVINEKGESLRPVKGGGFNNFADLCRASSQQLFPPSVRHVVSSFGLRVARVRVAAKVAAFEPLLNGQELSGWKKSNPNDTGQAEVIVVDGQPTLKLSQKSGMRTEVIP